MNPSKRVLVVVTHPVGGIRTYLLYNASILREAGYAFTFLGPEGEAFELFKQDISDWPEVEFIDATVKNRKRRFRPAIRKALRTGKYLLVHSQGLRAGTEAALANLGMGVPHVITLHDVIVPQNEIPGRFKWLKKRLIGWASGRADVIVPVSNDCGENHLEHLPEWRRGRCRLNVIYNGIDVPRVLGGATSPSGLRRHLEIDEGVVLAGFFGRFMRQKGFRELLDALRRLASDGWGDRLRLIAIRDPHGYRDQYVNAVKDDPTLARMVRFIEPVPSIAPVLSQMDLLVMPSLWEACPILPMEAMVLGVPVLGTDCLGLREVLAGTPNMTVPAGDAGELAAGLRWAIETPWNEAARKYTPTAIKRFDVQDAAGKLKDVFDGLT